MEASWWKDVADLDDDQKAVISLGDCEDHLIVGPPGCGKTNLLLLRASYLHKKGTKNIKVLAFGRILKEFIAAGTNHYPFDTDKVQNYVRWAYEILAANGIEIDTSGPFKEVRERIFTELTKISEEGKPENIYDVILLDEAQDYSAEEANLIYSFANRIYAVGDDNQRITEKSGALEKLESLGAKPVVLRHHYRNGIKICRVADGIKNLIDSPQGMEATSNYDETKFPATVEVFGDIDLRAQISEAVPRIKTQLQAYPDEIIGILCPRAEDLEAVVGYLQGTEIETEVQVQKLGAYTELQPDRPVVISTVQGAKGLEFRAVHLVAADKLKNFRTQKNLTYTAVTRAKTSLVVYHHKNLPGYFEKGLDACEITKPIEPKIEDLFK